MTVETSQIKTFICAAAETINANAEEVTQLDQAIGDGDHVTNLQRGLEKLSELADGLDGLDWSTALQKMGMSVMSTVGGASGSLYGTLLMAMSKAMKDQAMDMPSFSSAFQQGVEAMKQRGRSDVGEKTMLDVLVPVAKALQDAAAKSLPLGETLALLNAVAKAGCESTRDMLPTKGRASFLGERAKGCIDAGARTAQLMIEAITARLS